MKTILLSGKSREITRKSAVKAMRNEGSIPCVLYGQGVENLHFSLSEKDLKKILYTPNSYVVELDIDGNKSLATFHSAQFHPLTDKPLHIDFLAISKDKPVVIDVPILFKGNSIGVREGGKLMVINRKIRVSAMLDKLPDTIDLDITPMRIGSSFYAEDVKVDGVQIVTPNNTIICSVRMTRAAIGAAAAAAATDDAPEAAAAADDSSAEAETSDKE